MAEDDDAQRKRDRDMAAKAEAPDDRDLIPVLCEGLCAVPKDDTPLCPQEWLTAVDASSCHVITHV